MTSLLCRLQLAFAPTDKNSRESACLPKVSDQPLLWLISMLAAIGVSPEERQYVDRWGISSANEYLRTAQHMVIGLQEPLITYFCGPDTWDLCNAGIDELESHLQDRRAPSAAVRKQCQILRLPPRWCT